MQSQSPNTQGAIHMFQFQAVNWFLDDCLENIIAEMHDVKFDNEPASS